jgi:DNA-3-methyladenine glycosylase II
MTVRIPHYWQEAIAHVRSDPVMDKLISRYPHSQLESRGDAFHTLARCIVGQQVSVASADAVWGRLVAYLQEHHHTLSPESILKLDDEAYRRCGFSRQKIAYMRNIAEFSISNALHLTDWDSMDDAQVTAYITQIKGIGRWSAEMLLLFCLLRPDVFPLADIGLQRAMAMHYNVALKPFDAVHALEIAAQWQPYRSVALWFLWRSIDPNEVCY